ncbi:MAG: hypothetical protein HZA54_17550, partial [Planctomycetes bacterium]|nr:hypothetical protein [Planctomycetota bacterium]
MMRMRRRMAAALVSGVIVAGCGTTPPWKAPLTSARQAAIEGRNREAIDAQCLAIQKLDEVGESKRAPVTLAAIYHQFHVLDAVRIYREADEVGRNRMAPLGALLARHGEGLDLLELSFGLALRRDQEGVRTGESQGDVWVLAKRSHCFADFLTECLRGRQAAVGDASGATGASGATEAAAPVLGDRAFAECRGAVTLARLASGHYAAALEQEKR